MSPKQDGESEWRGPFRISDWVADPLLSRLTRGDEVVTLRPRAMEVLICLVDRAGRPASKRHVIDTVWKAEFVSENALTQVVGELRAALGDDPQNPTYIETIPRRGYRLIAEVDDSNAVTADVEGPGALLEEGAHATPPEELSPYPGLAAFTEADAEHFFGREAETANLWERIPAHRMLAVIGPSGAGKSSFLRAGLIPAAPRGWRAVVSEPGERPFRGLARRLVRELSGDTGALEKLVDLDDPQVAIEVMCRWRRRHDHALLIVDQLEELFTLNPPEVQGRFASLLGRLVEEADIHVLLSMRDDFFFECSAHPDLAPVFESVTPLLPPKGAALRRALVEPAERRGFAFEDEGLVDEMLGEVAEERGVLPLLAFTVARLWDLRETEGRRLTRIAYERIGGVGGALAQHAEEVLEAIGAERLPVVRELFRNLVTSRGTRTIRDIDELLSVFDDREVAGDCLRHLVDGRLLSSWEVKGDADDERERRVEIIHESLLAVWPRLVRWQAQDVDGARLRDDLRQSARMWAERGRPEALLWTGTAFREYRLWRERYQGGLSDPEESFAAAMTELAGRRRRRRRLAAGAAGVLLAVLAMTMATLWRQTAAARDRAEAQKLLMLGRTELEEHPTVALAYARASLGVADTAEVRRFIVEALWHGGAARILKGPKNRPMYKTEFSPDGRWLAVPSRRTVWLYPDHGGAPRKFSGPSSYLDRRLSFDPRGELFVMWSFQDPEVHVFSLSEGRLLRSMSTGEIGRPHIPRGGEIDGRLITDVGGPQPYRMWPFGGGEPTVFPPPPATDGWCFPDPANHRFVFYRGRDVLVQPFDDGAPEVVVGSHDLPVAWVSWDTSGNRLASVDESYRDARVWSREDGSWRLERVLAVSPDVNMKGHIQFSPKGRWLVCGSLNPPTVLLYDLDGPPEAQPMSLPVRGAPKLLQTFHPDDTWLAVADEDLDSEVTLWPLHRPSSFLLGGSAYAWDRLTFNPESSILIGGHRVWPLGPSQGPGAELFYTGVAVHPEGRCIARGRGRGGVEFTCRSGEKRILVDDGRMRNAMAFDRTGRLLATATFEWADSPEQQVMQVIDLESGETREFPLVDTPGATNPLAGGIMDLSFSPEGVLLSAGWGGVKRWDLEKGSSEWVYKTGYADLSLSLDGGLLLAGGAWSERGYRELLLIDLTDRSVRQITTHGARVRSLALGPTGRVVVTGGHDGAVRVGSATGSAPHLLLGHRGPVIAVAVSPDGRWIASAADDGVRVWPMTALDEPPLHTLALDQLLARLDGLTNLYAVEDRGSSTGWKLKVGPFPGWRDPPAW